MINVVKPRLVDTLISEDKRYGKFVWEPLERGFGITLGNSLRRVLLSSLDGLAVTQIKIDGVLHEFSTIDGVREDVADIVLNIKALCFKAEDESVNEKVLRLNKKGEGEVTAADIECPGDVEILNPDLHIATLERGGELKMDIFINRGVGYVPSDRNKNDDVIGTIPVDSIYAPVIRVKFGVTNTRVGNMTNYDKLTLEVWTDGSIDPVQSVDKASAILQEYLGMFRTTNDTVLATDEDEDSFSDDSSKMVSIEDLDLTVRSTNCLRRAGINTIDDLCQRTEDDMMKIRNLGKKSLDEIKNKLKEMGKGFKLIAADMDGGL
ncbi:MAG: DNA-directed RNA polymerase subunit alpha [Phascolarctobacterium sp.]|nr:DNA-directed RNA polymerase subunit alpha [Candidatus Phascolarctobacterium caballi]